MYYLMDWHVDEEKLGLNLAEIDIVPDTDIPWTMGMFWGEPLAKSIELVLDPDAGWDLRDAFLVGIPCFSKRFIDRLKALGVDNFQEFDVVITDPRTNRQYLNYKAINIVGLVQCADLSTSTFFPGTEPPLMDFDHLVIDESKTGDQLFFRLFESAGRIIVHERVALTLIKESFVGVSFQRLDSRPASN